MMNFLGKVVSKYYQISPSFYKLSPTKAEERVASNVAAE
jgi:hypothetical protein